MPFIPILTLAPILLEPQSRDIVYTRCINHDERASGFTG